MKKFTKHIVAKIILFALLINCRSLAQQKDTTLYKKSDANQSSINILRERLDDLFNESNFNNANWGVLIKSLKTGEILYKKNSDKLFIPASNIKLFTSAAALLLLGANYVYSTGIFANGQISNGKLDGDLIIQGSGDPTISNRFWNGTATSIFEKWADSLIAKGIKEISGNIYGEDALFDNSELGKGWNWEIESSWYSAPTGALCFNDNSITISVKPGYAGFPAIVEIFPETKYVNVINKIITVDKKLDESIHVSKKRGTNELIISGKIFKGTDSFIDHISVSNPTMFFLTVLKETFIKKGIKCNGQIGSVDSAEKIIIPENLSQLLIHESVPLYLIVKEINKNSNNFYSEQILKTIGLENKNYGSTANGIEASRDLFYKMGINPENLVIVDGSGISRLNLVSPRQIVNLLTFMNSTDESNIYYDSLPIGGVDGTLANRMKKISSQKNIRAKAGFLENVSTLSGYITTVSGETLAFSVMINNFLVPLHLVHFIEDEVCKTLVDFVRN